MWLRWLTSDNILRLLHLSFSMSNLGTLQKVIDSSSDQHIINFSNDRISGAQKLCSLKVLQLQEGDDSFNTNSPPPEAPHI